MRKGSHFDDFDDDDAASQMRAIEFLMSEGIQHEHRQRLADAKRFLGYLIMAVLVCAILCYWCC
jgi:hypothetical protein